MSNSLIIYFTHCVGDRIRLWHYGKVHSI